MAKKISGGFVPVVPPLTPEGEEYARQRIAIERQRIALGHALRSENPSVQEAVRNLVLVTEMAHGEEIGGQMREVTERLRRDAAFKFAPAVSPEVALKIAQSDEEFNLAQREAEKVRAARPSPQVHPFEEEARDTIMPQTKRMLFFTIAFVLAMAFLLSLHQR